MALPTGELFVNDFPGAFTAPEDSLRTNRLKDFERAGTDIQNPNSGFNVRSWTCEKLSTGDVIVYPADDVAYVTTMYTDLSITALSFCFDRSMNPTLAVITPSNGVLRWYDTSVLSYVTQLFSGTDCYLLLDDKGQFSDAYADVLLMYLRGPNLYYRQQRDRFLVERLLYTFAGPDLFIRRAARCDNHRVQVEFYGLDARPASL